MPFYRNSKDGDVWECPICGKIIKTPYYIYEPHEEALMIACLFGSALDHILENHCLSQTITEEKEQ